MLSGFELYPRWVPLITDISFGASNAKLLKYEYLYNVDNRPR